MRSLRTAAAGLLAALAGLVGCAVKPSPGAQAGHVASSDSPATLAAVLPESVRKALAQGGKRVSLNLLDATAAGGSEVTMAVALVDAAGKPAGDPWPIAFGHEPSKPSSFVVDITDALIEAAKRPKFDPVKGVTVRVTVEPAGAEVRFSGVVVEVAED